MDVSYVSLLCSSVSFQSGIDMGASQTTDAERSDKIKARLLEGRDYLKNVACGQGPQASLSTRRL